MVQMEIAALLSSSRPRRFSKTIVVRALSGLLTLSCLGLLLLIVWAAAKWSIIDASMTADARQAECAARGGACWSVITNRWRLILFGLYPFEEHWRSATACVVVVATVILSCMPAFWRATRLAALWFTGFTVFYVLMMGGVFGLPLIREEQWGGLSLTLFVFSATALIGMPLAIVLALLRNSKLPWISKSTGIIIDTIRSLPIK